MKPQFELRRVRDFGEIISDTFTFFKDNFKALLKPLLIICSFFIVAGTISFAFMQNNVLDVMSGSTNPGAYNNTFDGPQWTVNYFASMAVFYLVFMFYMLSILLVTYSYMAIYMEKPQGEKPTLVEVWGYYKYYFLRVLGSAIVCTILISIGTVICVLPGIYLATVLSLMMPIMIFENGSFNFSFSKSFTLIKGNWWLTFGCVFVISLVIGFASYLVNLPYYVLLISKVLLKFDMWMFPLVLICGFIANLFYLSYSLMAITISMCYFSYSEQKEGTGLMNRINTIGQDNNDLTNLPKEEF